MTPFFICHIIKNFPTYPPNNAYRHIRLQHSYKSGAHPSKNF